MCEKNCKSDGTGPGVGCCVTFPTVPSIPWGGQPDWAQPIYLNPFPLAQFQKLNPDAIIPSRGTACSAGLDLSSVEEVTIAPGDRRLVKTGLSMSLPWGYEGQVRPRSGLALKHGITVLNAPGTIDSDYRGEVGVILLNTGRETFTVKKGDRIAQLVIARVEMLHPIEVTTLDQTQRGIGGFGSTGIAQTAAPVPGTTVCNAKGQ